jgi:quercetin dioxygenase-like cupin family protein
VRRVGEIDRAGPASLPADGIRRRVVVDEAAGSVHTGFALCELDPRAGAFAHVHSYEESLFVLAGEPTVETSEGAFLLRAGDYGVVPVGVTHSVRNDGDAVARWAEMTAPQPRAALGGDTFVVTHDPPREARPLDVRDPRVRSFGHIEPSNMDPGRQTQDMLAVSASMRTALLVYSGITVKMMVDTDLGAQLSTMFMVQYEPNGLAGAHDHPFEETYLIVEGVVDAAFDDQRYRLSVGDVAWAGAGCQHAFTNPGPGIVRWLETQAPQPPARHSYRFARDWDHLRETLGRHPASKE